MSTGALTAAGATAFTSLSAILEGRELGLIPKMGALTAVARVGVVLSVGLATLVGAGVTGAGVAVGLAAGGSALLRRDLI